MFITFCISVSAGFLPFNRLLSLQRTLSFMPFFFLGYYMKEKNIYLNDKYKPYCFLFLISTISVPIFFPNFLGDLFQADPYSSTHGALQRMFTFSLAIMMSISFINICHNTEWIARQGKLTMQYYLYHAPLITLQIAAISKMNIQSSFISASICTILLLLTIYLLSQLPFFRVFTNPSNIFKTKHK